MVGWLEDVAGPGFAAAVLWTLLALVLLVIVLVIVRLVRSMTFGTFVVGGKNRKTRLAVMDATPVDSHRRLVLVRRDDVEHLILIGGPTDVVVEQHIRAGVPQQVRRPSPPEGSPEPAARPRPSGAPAPVQQPPRQPEPQMRSSTPPPPAQPAQPLRGTTPPPPARPVEPRAAAPKMPPAPPSSNNNSSPAAKKGSNDDLDDALANELAVSLEPPKKKKPELSLEDEMNKLLGELTAKKK
jgi:hypothetical protein